MFIDDAIEIKKPAPDSHFLLKNCRVCRGDNVAYVKHEENGSERFRVTCFDCGHTVQPERAACAHDAQVAWNRQASRMVVGA